MIKAKLYKGQKLKGLWQFTRKIDGVRMLRNEAGFPVSRSDKPLYNLGHVPKEITDAEIFLNNWGESVSLVRSMYGDPVPLDCVYSLYPLDERLILGYYHDPSPDFVADMLKTALAHGDEGLVIRQGDKWLKVKPVETYDVPITGLQPGTGKYVGKMGALLTPMGKVGTGFTDAMRDEEWTIGEIIEVECMQLTDDGKFRHPRFVRRRFDK